MSVYIRSRTALPTTLSIVHVTMAHVSADDLHDVDSNFTYTSHETLSGTTRTSPSLSPEGQSPVDLTRELAMQQREERIPVVINATNDVDWSQIEPCLLRVGTELAADANALEWHCSQLRSFSLQHDLDSREQLALQFGENATLAWATLLRMFLHSDETCFEIDSLLSSAASGSEDYCGQVSVNGLCRISLSSNQVVAQLLHCIRLANKDTALVHTAIASADTSPQTREYHDKEPKSNTALCLRTVNEKPQNAIALPNTCRGAFSTSKVRKLSICSSGLY